MRSAGFKHVSSFSIVGAAAALALLFTVGLAVAQGTPEQQQACSGDAQRLCGEFIPDVQKITACMAKKRAQLTPACRAAFSTPTHKPPKKTRRTS
jgi:hypothetical protein